MKRFAALLLTATALSACMLGEEDRREFLYKPAYCLAGGLAQMNSEACLPQKLKEDAVAIATAKLVEPAAPSVAKHVYYTEDQRLSMGLEVASVMFPPNAKLTRSSVAISLEANALVPLKDDKTCGAKETRAQAIDHLTARMTDSSINRETAKFLSEHYSDLQLSELYRVAKANGTIQDVSDDAFIMPDPKDAKKSVNIKPQANRSLGSIISYTTSKTVSELIRGDRKAIVAGIAQMQEQNHMNLCVPREEPKPIEPVEIEKAREDAAKIIAPAKEGASK